MKQQKYWNNGINKDGQILNEKKKEFVEWLQHSKSKHFMKNKVS